MSKYDFDSCISDFKMAAMQKSILFYNSPTGQLEI